MTWYKRQYMTASQLGVNVNARSCNQISISATPQPPAYSSPLSQNRRPSVRFRQNRLSFFSWNIGQLNMSKWDLFRAWLHQQPIDCACLQDTGWQFTGEWKDQQFSYIHSGAGSGSGSQERNHEGRQASQTRRQRQPKAKS